jgi:hypothetical protein
MILIIEEKKLLITGQPIEKKLYIF